jgi:glycosyltransferase involved in cell wall biosynthesis
VADPTHATGGGQEIAVVVCAHSFDRLEQTTRCIASLIEGSRPPDQIIVVVDGNSELEVVLAQQLPSLVEIVPNEGRGLSAGRNTGLRRARSEVVAFIDDDAWAESEWLAELESAFSDASVIGAGGRIVPAWEDDRASLPDELLWIVGSTYAGHRTDAGPITRPIGANMAGRRTVLLELGGFSADFGPQAGAKTSSNDELSIFGAVSRRFGTGRVTYVPSAVVHHYAPRGRCDLAYVIARSRVEGSSKAEVRALHGREVMSHDRHYAFGVLLPAIARRCCTAVVRADANAARQAMMLVVSFGVTASAYGTRRASHFARARRREPRALLGFGKAIR